MSHSEEDARASSRKTRSHSPSEDLPASSPPEGQPEIGIPTATAATVATSAVVSPSLLHSNIPNQEEETRASRVSRRKRSRSRPDMRLATPMPPDVPQATDSSTAGPAVTSPALVVSAPIYPNTRNLEEEKKTSRISRRRRSHGRPDVLNTSPMSPEVLQVDDSTASAPAAATAPAVVVEEPMHQNICNLDGQAQTSQMSRFSRSRPEVTPTSSLRSEGNQEVGSSAMAPCAVTDSAEVTAAPLHPDMSDLEETRTSQVCRGQPVFLPSSPMSPEVPQGADSKTTVLTTATTQDVAVVALLNQDVNNLEKFLSSQGTHGPPASLPASPTSTDISQETAVTATAPATLTMPPDAMPPPLPSYISNVEDETHPSRISRRRRSRARPEALPMSPMSPENPLDSDTATTATVTTSSVGVPPSFRPNVPNLGERRMSRMSRSRRSGGPPEDLPVSPLSPESTQGLDTTATAPATKSAVITRAPAHSNTEGEALTTLTTGSKRSRGCPVGLPMSQLTPGNPQEVAAATTIPVTTTTTSAPPLDNILIFGHGRFQRLILLCATLAFFASKLHTAGFAVLARPVDHWCRPPAEYAHLPAETWKNSSVPLEAGRHSQCLRYDPPIPVVEGAYVENRSTVPCDNGWDYESRFNIGLGAQSIVAQWDIVCDRRWILGVLSALNLLGGAIGAPIAGVTADMLGRRPVLIVCVIFLMFAGIALAFANTMLLLIALDTLLTAAASSVFVTSVVVLFEVTDMQHRLAFCCLAVVGAGLIAAPYQQIISKFSLTWQACQIAYMIPSCGLVLAVYLVEESPCWLLAVSDVRRAETVLSWAARVNRTDPKSFKRRLSTLKIELKRQQQTQTDTGAPNIFSTEQVVHASDLVRNQSLRQRSLIIFGCFFTNVAVYYNLKTGQLLRTNHVADKAHLLLLLPAMLVDVFIVMRTGRRRSLALGMVVLSLLAAALGTAHILRAPENALAAISVSWILVFSLCSIAMFVLSAELFPTVLRGAGVSFCYAFGRVGGLVGSLVDAALAEEMRGAAYIAVAALLLLFGTLAFALPETTAHQPANTMRDVMPDKWQLYSPLRVARGQKRPRL